MQVASLSCPSTGRGACHPAWTRGGLALGEQGRPRASTTLEVVSGWVLSPEGRGHPAACSPGLHLPFFCSLQWNFIQANAATALAQALKSNSSLASLE